MRMRLQTMNVKGAALADAWNGWLVLDKPVGITSAHAVAKVKRLLRPRKIGHGGTLDPLASGILPLALGEATKAFQFVAANSKTYRFTVRWGEERSTDDREGSITARSPQRPCEREIRALLPAFTGEILQAPPIYSAIKVQGERAYDKARSGENFTLPPRLVYVQRLELLQMPDENQATFEMACGKGVYVRAIARDFGRKLGCYGYVSALRRVAVGKFHENAAISLEKLEELVHIGGLEARLLPISSVLDDIPAVEVDVAAAKRLGQGQKIACHEAIPGTPEMVQVLSQGQLVAIAERCDNILLRPVRVFLTGMQNELD